MPVHQHQRINSEERTSQAKAPIKVGQTKHKRFGSTNNQNYENKFIQQQREAHLSEQEGVYSENINSDQENGRKNDTNSNDNGSVNSRLSNRRKILHIERSKQQTPKVMEAGGDQQKPTSTRGSMPAVK